jgi:ankyrin repeat protein
LFAALVSATSFGAQSRIPLIDAAEAGDEFTVSTLLAEGASVDDRRVDQTTALHTAVREDHPSIARMVLSAGADAVATDRYGITPLYLAAVNGNEEMIRLLLDAGADPNAIAPQGETALMTTTRTGLTEAMQVLIDRGARVDARELEFEQTALMIAVRQNHPSAVDLLIRNGADPNVSTRIGPTPEFVPPCKGTGCGSEGVGINRGGLPDRGRRAPIRGGMTSLHYAAREGRIDEARLLVGAGADAGQVEANSISPLLMAILNNHLDVAELLIESGADVNVDDYWGRTPLWAAVEYRNLDMNNRAVDSPTDNGVDREPFLDFITLLLDHDADVNAQTREVWPARIWLYSLNDVSWVDFTGQTPFLRAALSGDATIMRLLLEYGADPNLATLAGTTPLMAAAGVNWVVAQTYTVSTEALINAIQMCLDLGAQVNATNSMGLSALLGAANRASNDIIRLLVSNGADLDVVDREGRTALRWAEGVFLAAVGAEQKPATIALLEELMDSRAGGED